MGSFFIQRFVCCMTKKSWAFSDLVAAISAALHETLFVVNTLTVFLSFCYIYKNFVRQLKAFPPSLCHFCACEMSPGWGHLITWMVPSVGHLNGILARVGGNLNNNFQKSQMPGGLPGGACWSFDLTDTLYRDISTGLHQAIKINWLAPSPDEDRSKCPDQ